jgi:ferritin
MDLLVCKFSFTMQAEEERNHMMKILEYILNRGAKAKVSAIPAPVTLSVNNCFEKVFERNRQFYKVVKMALDEEDWATWNFLQWFVKEQIEEENLANYLMDKITLAGGENAKGDALYQLDKDLENFR